MIVYISGPYRGDVDANIQAAREAAIKVWEAGHTAICPHLNTAHFEDDCSLDDDRYVERDMDILARCDGILMLPGWEASVGARTEHAYALDLSLPVWRYPELPGPHPTEESCPRQCRAFIEEVMRLYRLHLSKNLDYGPASILGTGEIGLMARIWDKTARLLNLYGWRLRIEESVFERDSLPRFESVEDTLQDLAAYAVIGLLLREGIWGR